MAVKPTLLLSPDGSWDASGRVQPTLTGGVITVPGQYGNAWQVAEATTNIFSNPSAEVDLTRISIADGTVERTDEYAYIGDYSVKAISAGSLPRVSVFTNTTAGQAVSFSAWVYHDHGIDRVFQTSGLSLNVDHIVPSGVWTRIGHSGISSGGTTYFQFRLTGSVAGEIYYVDAIQIEEKANITPYADGDMPGHTWDGTPHASNSTRPNSYVTYGWVPKPDAGAIIMRAANLSVPMNSANPYLFSSGSPSAGHIFLAVSINRDTGQLRRTIYIGGVNLTSPYTYSPPMIEGEMTTVALAWADGIVKFYVDGNLIDQTDLSAYTWPETTAGISLGRYSDFVTNLAVDGALTFDTALTDAEVAEYTAMGAWTYNSTFGPSTNIVFPDIRSGLHLVETKIHKSDMYGNIGDEITGEVVTAGITSDLDRAGSKTHIDITAVGTANLLPAGSWITPVQEVSREGEGTVQVQRGVFELDQPEVESAGVRFIVSNSGKDIVDLLARSALLDTFYTPTNGYVMRDIELAIRMLGITSLGANIVPNGSFENGGDGWLGPLWTAGGAGSFDFPSRYSVGIADGTRYFYVMHSTGSAAGGAGYVRTGDLPVPQGVDKMLLSAMHYVNSGTRAYISTRFHDAAGVQIPGSVQDTSPSGEASMNGGWYRVMRTINVPPGSAFVRLWVFIQDLIGGRANHGSFDDIQLRACTGDLLPASMLALPQSRAKATSRIQHLTSDPRLAAVNDRLAAIGMMAVNATNDSKYTSRMSRDPNKDAAVRQYDIEKDIRITGDIQTWRNTSNKYNRVFAVKEDYTEGTVMTAIAENKDLDDPWNIYRSVLTPKRIDVRDAVDVATLQLAADQELAKASMQESVSFSIVPDPTLTVYDIIEITGPSTNPAIGKWAIESIDSGLTASDPLMNIGARRTKKGV